MKKFSILISLLFLLVVTTLCSCANANAATVDNDETSKEIQTENILVEDILREEILTEDILAEDVIFEAPIQNDVSNDVFINGDINRDYVVDAYVPSGAYQLFKVNLSVHDIDSNKNFIRCEVVYFKDYSISGISSICLDAANLDTHVATEYCDECGHLDCGVYISMIDDNKIAVFYSTQSIDSYYQMMVVTERENVTIGFVANLEK